MNKIIRHLLYYFTGIFIMVMLYYFIKAILNTYSKGGMFKKVLMLSIFSCFMLVLVWESNRHEKIEKEFSDSTYKNYDKYQNLNSIEIEERAERRKNGTMTNEDMK